MKKCLRLAMGAAFLFIVSLVASNSAFCMDEPGFTLSRMVVSESIVDREPAGAADQFSAATEQVYCFLEAKDIDQDTEVSFVWFHNDTEKARVTLPLRKGNRWRTKSSKKLGGLKGSWKVELQDASGIVLNTVAFSVE